MCWLSVGAISIRSVIDRALFCLSKVAEQTGADHNFIALSRLSKVAE